MFRSLVTSVAKTAIRSFSTSSVNNAKVCVVGGAGGIGQPMSMLLKMDPLVSHLSVVDVNGAPGVAADLSHIDSRATVIGTDNIREGLEGIDVVVIPAGVPRKPGMTRQDLFTVNATLNRDFADAVCDVCPNAMVAIISNPVNSTVPIFVEQMRKRGFDPRRVFGVTTLDLVRANTFVSEAAGISVDDIHVPVIGGHAGASILPVISQTTPPVEFDQATIEALTHRIQNGGTEVVKAKAGAGSATLSMAKAGAQFAANLIKANNGEEGIIEYAYIESDSTESAYFSTPLKLGRDGTFENLGLPELNDYEQKLLVDAIKELEGSIKDGVEFVVSGVIPE